MSGLPGDPACSASGTPLHPVPSFLRHLLTHGDLCLGGQFPVPRPGRGSTYAHGAPRKNSPGWEGCWTPGCDLVSHALGISWGSLLLFPHPVLTIWTG